jgi:hypothetical protein
LTGPSAVAPCAATLACMGYATASPGVGRCAPPFEAGLACSLDLRCAAPALCHVMQPSGAGLCVLPGKSRDGEACQSDLDCTSLACDPDVGRCRPSGQMLCAGAYNYAAQETIPLGGGKGGSPGATAAGGVIVDLAR